MLSSSSCFIVLLLSLHHITTAARMPCENLLVLCNKQRTRKAKTINRNFKKLLIAVPIRDASNKVVRMKDGRQCVEGFSIDVFVNAMTTSPNLHYTFCGVNSSSSGGYDNLVQKIKNGTYDLAVGDITIRDQRYKDVDFTQPYTSSQVSLVVPYLKRKRKLSKGMWSFLDPLTWQLWVAGAGFVLFTSLIICLLEREARQQHLPRHRYPAGNTLWYFISTMFLANGHLMSKLARLVVTVLFFVIWIMVQCYTASLASLLTAEQLMPILIDESYLKSHHLPVGYQKGSFVENILKNKRFKEENLKGYLTEKEFHEMFSNKTIVAAFDETPYVEAYLKSQCHNYSVTPVFDTGGFGFVLRKGSPLNSNLSLGILQLRTNVNGTTTETPLDALKRKNLLASKACSSEKPGQGSQLDIDGFMGLFILAGGISCLALLVGLRHFRRQYEAERHNLDLNPYDAVRRI